MIVVIFGYVRQAVKVVKIKSTIGVSFELYVIALIGSSSMIFFAETNIVFYLGLVEVIFVLFPIYFIYIYKEGSKIKINKDFILSFLLGLIMIFGVRQLLELIKDNYNNNVSVSAFYSYISLSGAIFYIAESPWIRLATAICVLVYIGIIFLAIKGKNEAKKTIEHNKQKKDPFYP